MQKKKKKKTNKKIQSEVNFPWCVGGAKNFVHDQKKRAIFCKKTCEKDP